LIPKVAGAFAFIGITALIGVGLYELNEWHTQSLRNVMVATGTAAATRCASTNPADRG